MTWHRLASSSGNGRVVDMERDLYCAGEVLVSVKGPTGSTIAGVSQLGLAETPISWSPSLQRLPVIVNAFGQGAAEVQQMGLEADITIPLVDFDLAVLKEIIRLSAASSAFGTNARAGQRFGNNLALYAAGNYFWSLGLSCPVAGDPITFLACYLSDNPLSWPMGAERSVVSLNVHAISYAVDRSTLAGVVCWNGTPLS